MTNRINRIITVCLFNYFFPLRDLATHSVDRKVLWKDMIKDRVSAVSLNEFIAIGCLNGDLYLFTTKGILPLNSFYTNLMCREAIGELSAFWSYRHFQDAL
jgi:hypothetical protein